MDKLRGWVRSPVRESSHLRGTSPLDITEQMTALVARAVWLALERLHTPLGAYAQTQCPMKTSTRRLKQ